MKSVIMSEVSTFFRLNSLPRVNARKTPNYAGVTLSFYRRVNGKRVMSEVNVGKGAKDMSRVFANCARVAKSRRIF